MCDKLCLDVGGTVFHTTYTTLSRERESMLARMFGGELRPAAEELGRHFIDRDGTHFRYILNYLRDGTVALPHDEQLQKELLVEANYYGLDGFVEGLRMGFPDRARLQPTLPGRAFASQQPCFTPLQSCNSWLACRQALNACFIWDEYSNINSKMALVPDSQRKCGACCSTS